MTFLVVILLSSNIPGLGVPTIDNLKVEYSSTPIGIDVELPRFSWQMFANEGERGIEQHAYRIEVRNPLGEIMWDTKKIESGVSVGIKYAGTPLKATTRYSWSITVWIRHDAASSNSSWFETGLLNPGQDAWDGAQWIGGTSDDMVLYSHYLSVFKIEYGVQLDQESGSCQAGFVLGANDHRLLNKDMNIYGLESELDGHYVKFEVDLSAVDGSDEGLAKFNVYRVGYHPDDKADKPLKSIAIPLSLISLENKYETHQISVEVIFGTLTIYVNGTGSENKIGSSGSSRFGRGGININPIGSGGNYISFPMLADIGFSMDAGQKALFSDLTIRNFRKPSNALFGEDLTKNEYEGVFSGTIGSAQSGMEIEQGKFSLEGGDKGLFVVADPSHNSMPMLRTEFSTETKSIKKARLYVTARGIYEIYLNGKRVGDDYFNPGLTQYNKTHFYQSYDVSDMLQEGSKNAIGAWLGEGWWSGNYTFSGTNWNFFGDRQSLLAKLVITYDDGSENVLTTNDQDWKCNTDGPLMYGSFFQGEAYDARKEAEIEGWASPDFDDESWHKAVKVDLEGTAFLGQVSAMRGPGMNLEYDHCSLLGQIGENAGIIKELMAVSSTEVRPGVFVYDMGQNMVGIPKVTIGDGTAGKKICLRFAEVLYPDMDEYGDNSGMIMLENIRAALAQDLYILKEGENVIQPHFTFHGYRYIEITGIDKALPLDAVKGLVISSMKDLSASYETSNRKVNRLFENIVWSQFGNFLSIPTDCPQRNERMGWSGDLSVYGRTSTYLANTDQFFRRHMFAMRDVQYSDGRYPDVAPVDNGFGGILWGSAGITVAWETYRQYGDIGLLEEHYESMKSYMEFLHEGIDETSGVMTAGMLGDWLSPEQSKNDNSLLFSAYYIFDLEIMARVAEVLGNGDDAADWWEKHRDRKAHFNLTYFDAATQKSIKSSFRSSGFGSPPAGDDDEAVSEAGNKIKYMDSQVSYAVPLALGAFNDTIAPLAAQRLVEIIKGRSMDDGGVERPEYSLMTGFIGTAWISKALSDFGYSDIAYRLLLNEAYPSWLYPVNQGATSIWERLNSYTHDDGFGGNNSMNSFNHYSFGAVGQWMMAYSLGIERGEPGFRNFILQPEPDPTGQMEWAEGYYDSMYGRISSSWHLNKDTLSYKTTVPANTFATLYMPAISGETVKEGDSFASEASGVTFLNFENGKAVYKLTSGSYVFESLVPEPGGTAF